MSTRRRYGLLKKPRPFSRSGLKHRNQGRFVPALESLGNRVLPAVTALLAAGTLRVTGDDADNAITVSRDAAGTIVVNGGAVPIVGGPATVANTNHLHIVGAGGNDTITLDEANGALPGAALFGGAGNDVLTSGSGDDFVDGGVGNDTVFLGAGDDDFQWNPGDGSDVVDGQAGKDTLVFNGADVAEKFDLSANLSSPPGPSGFFPVRFTRDVGNVGIDLNGIDDIELRPLGGADTVTVNDLSATALLDLNLDLSGATGAGDGQADTVIVNGTNQNDVIQVAAFDNRTRIAVSGLTPVVNVTAAEPAHDRLTVNALDGNDLVDAGSLPANLIGVTLNGGTGTNDIRRPLFGDADGNGVVDGADFAAFRSAFGGSSAILDFDGNGIVDGLDFGQFRASFGVSI